MANSRKKNRRRKTLSAVLIVLAILIAGAAVGVKLLRQRVTEAYGEKSKDEAQKATVTRGSISTTITGSGTLSAQETESVSLPGSVQLRSLLVEKGDTVSKGDVLAYLDLTSILTAMNDLQTQLDELDEDIAEAAKESVSTVMKSTVNGRVKGIYCKNGDSVLSVMSETGALLSISLDGHMAVDIPAQDLAAGDSLSVTLSDGSVYTGTVGERKGESVAVLITDNRPLLGDQAVVSDQEGRELGSGVLYIHQPLNITGYAGTVSRLAVTENDYVTKERVLLYLSDTAFTANYDALLQERVQLEEKLTELISYYRSGVVLAPLSGKVESLTEQEDSVDASADWIFVTIQPQEKMIVTASIDESNILSVELGQTASVTISSISDDPFTGEVTSIEKTGTSSSGVTGYSVEVTVDRTEKMLSRMSASVAIRIEGVDDALILPEDAVTKTRTSAYVYTSVDESTGELTGMTEVKTGLTGGGYIEITEGLKEGDTVYYTKKQSNDFSSFMGSFGGMPGGSGSSGFGGSSGGFGGSMPGGSSGGNFGGSGSGSGRPSGSGSNRPSGSGRNGG